MTIRYKYIRKFPYLLILGLLFSLSLNKNSFALIEVNVNSGKIEPVNIAVTDFLGENSEEKEFGTNIADVIAADLESSGFFTPLDKNSFINPHIPFSQIPEFNNWRAIKSKFLVTGEVTIFNNRKAEIKFILFDVTTQKNLKALKLTSRPTNWRRIAHQIADAIYSRITGESAYFDTQVVFIDESGPKTNRIKRLAIMDRDGYNPRFLTNGEELVITPRFSPTNQEITYMSFSNNQPKVYLFNIATRQKEIVGELNGITFSPRFSPGGEKIIMSLLHGDASNIFTMDLRNRKWTRLTNSNSINTAPCYSPDGTQIVFESDMNGSRQLYVMNSDGTQLRQISNGVGEYSTPVWSPKNNLIAFTKQYKGRFLIGVMNIDGTGERIITEGYHNEGPTWAPNGRVLMFFRDTPSENGGPSLYSVDVTGYNERRIITPNFASDPAWSPLIN